MTEHAVDLPPVVAEPVYPPGCGPDCTCQRRRLFGCGYVVFSSGETDEIEEIPGPRYCRRRRHTHRPRARVRVFIRPRYLEVS
jgi:hypothetical protein